LRIDVPTHESLPLFRIEKPQQRSERAHVDAIVIQHAPERRAVASARICKPRSGGFSSRQILCAYHVENVALDRCEAAVLPDAAIAGLWESWRETKESEPLSAYTIVTGPPGLVSGDIHDRAPVILDEDAWDAWLAGEVADAADVLKAAQEPQLTYYPVSKAVGSPKNDSPDDLVASIRG
jgi:hypothetical protein